MWATLNESKLLKLLVATGSAQSHHTSEQKRCHRSAINQCTSQRTPCGCCCQAVGPQSSPKPLKITLITAVPLTRVRSWRTPVALSSLTRRNDAWFLAFRRVTVKQALPRLIPAFRQTLAPFVDGRSITCYCQYYCQASSEGPSVSYHTGTIPSIMYTDVKRQHPCSC